MLLPRGIAVSWGRIHGEAAQRSFLKVAWLSIKYEMSYELFILLVTERPLLNDLEPKGQDHKKYIKTGDLER